MAHGNGRVLKLVAQLLPFLPPGLEYRIVFMERSLDEVLSSQRVMLDRHGRKGAALETGQLKAAYERQLALVTESLQRLNLPVQRINHRDAIADPSGIARCVADFLALPLSVGAMADVVEPSLHRQRAGFQIR